MIDHVPDIGLAKKAAATIARQRRGRIGANDLDDLIQVGALAIHKARLKCDPTHKGRASYLYRAAWNAITEAIVESSGACRVPLVGIRDGRTPETTRLARIALLPAHEVPADITTSHEDPSARLEAEDESARVRAAVSALAGWDREVIDGYYRDGLTDTAIAARMHLSRQYVQTIRHRALHTLRSNLERNAA